MSAFLRRSSIALLACAGTAGAAYASPLAMTHGIASWYGRWHEGHRMANGHLFHSAEMTAASREYPLGVWVLVRDRRTLRMVAVRITDRGPYIAGRVIDLSQAAAYALGMIDSGLDMVDIQVIDQ